MHIDQLGREVEIPSVPQRIISLVPSQTELLHTLRLADRVVGITKFCVSPADWLTTKKRVGGTKNIDHDSIRQLKPDLIIANKEENPREDVEMLAKDYPVWVSDVHNLEDAKQMILSIGEITATDHMAYLIVNEIVYKFNLLKPLNPPLTAAYLVWRDPLMAAGGDTFIHDMMQRIGLVNIVGSLCRYPQVSADQLLKSDVILFSSEPFPFRENHLAEWRNKYGNAPQAVLVDGQMFSWYGSRLMNSPTYFERLAQEVL